VQTPQYPQIKKEKEPVMLYNLKVEIPVEADSPEEAVKKLLEWIDDRKEPFRPFVDVNTDGTMDNTTIDSDTLGEE
jgi:hypothetical protein